MKYEFVAFTKIGNINARSNYASFVRAMQSRYNSFYIENVYFSPKRKNKQEIILTYSLSEEDYQRGNVGVAKNGKLKKQ